MARLREKPLQSEAARRHPHLREYDGEDPFAWSGPLRRRAITPGKAGLRIGVVVAQGPGFLVFAVLRCALDLRADPVA